MKDPIQEVESSTTEATRDDRHAFPRLTEDQIERITRFGDIQTLDSGTVIFDRGDRSVDFFVVLKGQVEIYDKSVSNEKDETNIIHVHEDRGFTGELDLFSGRKILVSGRLVTQDGTPGKVLRISRPEFNRLMSAEPDVGQTVTRAFILRRLGLIDHSQGGVLILSRRNSADGLRLERFLRRNGYPMRMLYLDDPDQDAAAEAQALLKRVSGDQHQLPLVMCSNDSVLQCPDNATVAECLGLTELHEADTTYDVAVIGAGPAGLAAAVYAASEGLKTVVVESEAPGGQAGTSSRIENYLGFPAGVSGQELAARAEHQAQKFGATLSVPRKAQRLEACQEAGYRLHLDHGNAIQAHTVVIGCGARWRTLDLPNASCFEGSGLHYAATSVEADLCRDEPVIVVGGGNSAGQAAVFLSTRVKRVHMLVRGDNLASSMSDYLVQRIELSDQIELCTNTQIVGLNGGEWLEEVTWQTSDHSPVTHPIRHVFLMIGAVPNSDWLKGTLRQDDQGFLLTGANVAGHLSSNQGCEPWRGDRAPHALETSLPGVFAVGDIRSGSVKRVASAVGEGSVCVADIHQVLIEQKRSVAAT